MSYSGDLSDAEVLTRFESLGDNCEFGFVQRFSDCEESGLFRWARVLSADGLSDAIRNSFEGIFEYESTVPVDLGMLSHASTGLQWHTARTSVRTDAGWVCNLPEDEQRRIFDEEKSKYLHLRDKFLDVCRNGSKIFIFKMNDAQSAETIERLHNSLRAHGSATLLSVKVEDDVHKAGTVRILKPGLFEGYIDRFAGYYDADQVSRESWVTMCRAALDLHATQQHAFAT